MASQEAFAAGVLSDPETELEQPSRGWVFKCRGAVIDDPTPGYPWFHIEKDIQSQRKIDNAELFYTLTNTTGVGAAFTIIIVGTIRCLFLLP